MFKKIKELLKKIKELRKNPKTKTLVDLGFWTIFFFLIVIVVRGIGTTKTVNTLDKKENIISYEYVYSDNISTIYGRKYDGNDVFNILNNKYYYNGENVYKVSNHNSSLDSNFDIGFLKIDYNFLEEITARLDYNENGNSKVFMVPLVRFLNLYDNDVDVDLSSASNYNIIVSKYYKEDKLYMVSLDLTNYYKYKNIPDRGVLTIDLYNLNNVSDFTLDYDKLLGVKE